jgi:uncharacterized protein YprB with RNaseH-like and TPR domain
MKQLEELKKEDILFLDIETVPCARNFADAAPELRDFWEKKSRSLRDKEEKSIEETWSSAGIYAEFGKIIVLTAGFFATSEGKRIFRLKSFYGDNEKDLLESFATMLNRHFSDSRCLLCAHNGKEFDFPYIARRMLIHGIRLPQILDTGGRKPWEVRHLDTMELWKFGDWKSYTSIALLAHVFGIPTPKDDIDGSQVARVYYEEGDIERIEHYCRKDVLTVAQLFLRFRGERLLEESEVIAVS